MSFNRVRSYVPKWLVIIAFILGSFLELLLIIKSTWKLVIVSPSFLRWILRFSVFLSFPLLQNNNLERAADWIFSHAHELDTLEDESQGSQESGPQYKDGTGSM